MGKELIRKDNINHILNVFAREYKKFCGNSPAEITIVGGGSILINYQFRSVTNDIDIISHAPSGITDAIISTASKLGLPSDCKCNKATILARLIALC